MLPNFIKIISNIDAFIKFISYSQNFGQAALAQNSNLLYESNPLFAAQCPNPLPIKRCSYLFFDKAKAAKDHCIKTGSKAAF